MTANRNGQGMDTRADHPPEETLAAYVDGALTATEKVAVERHLDGCHECMASIAAVARLMESAPLAAARPRPAAMIRRAWWAIPLAAAGIVLMLTPRNPAVRERVQREEDLPPISVVAPLNDATTDVAKTLLAWRSFAGAEYRTYVLDARGAVVWSTVTSDTAAVIPAGILEHDEGYFWYADAVADRIVATTGVQHFQTSAR